MQLRRRLHRNDDGSGCRQVGCGRWGWCVSKAQKCAPARHRGFSAALINFENPTAAADAAVGRELARGARNSGSPPPCTSTCQQTQQGVPVSAYLGGKKQTGTTNLPAVVHGGNEIVGVGEQAGDALDTEGRWGSTSWSGGGRRRELQGCQTFIIDLGARLGLVRVCRGTPGRRTCMWLALMSSGNNELMRRDGRT